MQNIYKKVTDLIIQKLEEGVIPWQKTWNSVNPTNFVSGIEYKGINTILLGMQNYQSPFFLTFKQCKEIGGSVKTGEHSNMVVFWKPLVNINEDSENEEKVNIHFMLRYYNVFNTDQCIIPNEILEKKFEQKINNKILKAEQIIEGYKNPPEIKFNNMLPFPKYIPAFDRVEIQSIDNFHSSDEFYATLYHELTHSTGAKHRLARKGIIDSIHFGSKDYSQEELIAEIGSAFLCGISGINKTIDNQSAYIGNWLRVFNNDVRMVLHAASKAQKAVDYILNNSNNYEA